MVSWIFAFFDKKQCKDKIIYKEPEPPLDIQFSYKNFPTILYKDLFTGGNTWIGGYKYIDYNNKTRITA